MFTKLNKFLSLVASLIIFINIFIYSSVIYPKPIFGGNNNKITICHATSSEINPFVRIVVSENAYFGHFENPGTPKAGHEKDFIFDGDVECPSLSPTPTFSPSPTATIVPSPTQTVTPSPTKELCKQENAECKINESGKECCEGLVCSLFNDVSGNGKCLPVISPTLTPTGNPTESPQPTQSISPTLTPTLTLTVTLTPTPGKCDQEYTCGECGELNIEHKCGEQKMIYCMQHYECGFVEVESLLQCVQKNWVCACPTLYPTSTLTPHPAEKWTICHATSSDVHPYSQITVSSRSEGGHFDENGTPLSGHEQDILLTGDAECPLLTVTPTQTPSVTPTVTIAPTTSPTTTPTLTLTPSPTPSVLGLTLTKTNNTTGTIGKGSEFSYEIVLENTGEVAFSEVLVKDVLPGGFNYIQDSAKVDGNTIGNPENNNGLLTFNIGSLSAKSKKILIYRVKAVDDSVGGSYYNLAFALGKYIDPFTNESKIYESSSDDSKVTLGSGVDYSIKVGGQVLGISTITQILPATGSNIFLTIVVLAAMIVATKVLENKDMRTKARKILNNVGISVVLLITSVLYLTVFSGSVKAIADSVYFQDLPEYVLTDNFRLSYTAISNSTVKAIFYVRKDGESDWRQFGGTIEGYSGRVQVEGAQINGGDGRYYFKVVINNGTASDETNTYIDKGSPNPVSDYHKEKVAGGFYRLYWKTPDNEDFSRVFIYRSTDRSFTADGTTKVGEIGGNKNSNVTWENVGLDSNKDYYYAVRAVDKAGNASGIVADPETSVIIGTSAKTEYKEEAVKIVPSGKAKEEINDGQGDVLSGEDQATVTPEEKNVFQKIAQFAKDRTKITLGIVLLIAMAIYYVYKYRHPFKIDEIKTKKKI